MEIVKKIAVRLRALLRGEVYYVNGPDTLPPPLSRTEEAEVFAGLTANDPAARKKLIVHNLRLVVYIAKKFESTGIGIEDLVSIGTIGLIKAVNTFNPEKNIKFATYERYQQALAAVRPLIDEFQILGEYSSAL